MLLPHPEGPMTERGFPGGQIKGKAVQNRAFASPCSDHGRRCPHRMHGSLKDHIPMAGSFLRIRLAFIQSAKVLMSASEGRPVGVCVMSKRTIV